LRHSEQEFVAILDADYVPGRDFPARLHASVDERRRPRLRQARCDYLNAGDNIVTTRSNVSSTRISPLNRRRETGRARSCRSTDVRRLAPRGDR